MEKMEGFLFARPQRVYTTQTAHTPNFLGLHQNLGFWSSSNYGKGVIIGIIDTGTTPGHPSFNDNGIPPPPAKWKGKCDIEGASTIDRKIVASVSLGNKDVLDGESAFQAKDFPKTYIPLVYPGLNGDQNTSLCMEGSLDHVDVKGKVVVCDRGINGRIEKGQIVKDAGGVAMILLNQVEDGEYTYPDLHVLPASHVGYKGGVAIKTYISSTSSL
ncbi:putative cucumisin [Helianthus annuus]|uniref:Cucumisin n=1 Tax=Helianthus annuus TaxID=4232 RepID=A0A251VA63_HELAN|nr:putative cucumisin [Helianthus annuus]KAJ0594511.1 putative cucumisin [Helianthus annuus]KAJ0602722.1 putative cucumisin [Helianthus annuus]KAJ0609551.1 putative cucumisin [Helianthus annuus]KAJ0769599.1 putative cucumisin [Helianthus annuus]